MSLARSLGGTQQQQQQLPPQQQPQGTPIAQNAPTQAPVAAQPTITPPPPTETPPSGTGPGGCVLNAAFVADLTIPDNTLEAPGASFVKSWRVKNTGTCNWDASYQLIFAEGNQMSGPASVPINPTASGGTADLSVNLTAPAAPSSPNYIGKWRLKASNGVIFGGLTVVIVVPAPPTSAPTAAPTAVPPTAAPPGPGVTLVAIPPGGIIVSCVLFGTCPGQKIDHYVGSWSGGTCGGFMSADISKSGSTLNISVSGLFGGGLISALTGNVPFGGEPVHYDYNYSIGFPLNLDYTFHVVLDMPDNVNTLHVVTTGDASLDCNLIK
ncbi:MAG TPA: NBR1-Ig-like domain-containing protein [Anaerolineae bacterium]|nr:NBR1-Ig-like domain-containing protein [Anaerolineae bacterium]